MTTTYETIRGIQIAAVEALTPASLGGELFRVSLDEVDFRDWADRNKTSCFRRFTVQELPEQENIEVTNASKEWVRTRCECAVAYPLDYRYGGDNRRDMRDVAREDELAINRVLGEQAHTGVDPFGADAAAMRSGHTLEELDNVAILALVYEVGYWRSV